MSERVEDTCILTLHTTPIIGIMVWGAIAYNSRSSLMLLPGTITVTSYVEIVLEPEGLSFIQSVTNGILQRQASHGKVNTKVFRRK